MVKGLRGTNDFELSKEYIQFAILSIHLRIYPSMDITRIDDDEGEIIHLNCFFFVFALIIHFNLRIINERKNDVIPFSFNY